MNHLSNYYQNVNYFNTQQLNIPFEVFVWQGMANYYGKIILCGTTEPSALTGQGFIYIGDITCADDNPQYYILNIPNSLYTSVYGPRYDETTDEFTFVGSYNNNNDSNTYGFLYRGDINHLYNVNNYVLQMNYNLGTPYHSTFTHSTDGNFAVGNSGKVTDKNSNSWVYNINSKTFTSFSYPSSVTTTVYGIVKNTDELYTLVGGYSINININININKNLEYGFIVDMIYNENNKKITFINWTSLNTSNLFTHFEGISKTKDENMYTLSVDTFTKSNAKLGMTSLVERKGNSFEIIKSVEIDYGKKINKKGITTNNSILDNKVVGLFIEANETVAFQAIIEKW